MPGDKNLIYRVTLDASQAKQQALTLQAVLRQVNESVVNSPAGRAAAQAYLEQQRRQTQAARTGAQERVAAARAEANERSQQARVAAQQAIEAERRITQAARAEAQQRAAANRQTATQGGLGASGGLGNAVLGGVAGYFSIQGARQIANQAAELIDLDTAAKRAEVSFRILSGGADQMRARLNAIREAGGGTIDTLTAMRVGTQASALGLAKTTEEFGRLTTAARAVALVSPVIHDVQSAISELALASANTSYRRLDQLGLSVTEVKDRMAELQAQNEALDDSQAFAIATVDILNTKYGDILESQEAAASSTERFRVALAELRREAAGGWLGEIANQLAQGATGVVQQTRVAGGTNDIQAQIDVIEGLRDRTRTGPGPLEGLPFGIGEGVTVDRLTTTKAELDQVLAVLEKAQTALQADAPGAAGYQAQISEIVSEIGRWGVVTEEQIQRLQVIQSSMEGATGATTAFGTAIVDVEAALAEAAEAEEAVARHAEALERVADLQSRLGEIEGLPGADQIAGQVNSMATELLYSTTATEDQINKLAELEAMTQGAASASEYFTGATGAATGATANFGVNLSGLIGPLSAVEAGLYAAGDAADIARAKIAATLALEQKQAQFDQLQNQYQSALLGASRQLIPLTGTAGARAYFDQRSGAADEFIRGLQGQGLTDEQIQLELAGLIEQQTAAADQQVENAREAERLQKRAASEAERAYKEAARETEKAFKDAAADFISGLESTPGLFGTSDVTQQQLDLAKAGVPQNFADNYLRRLRDEVENGKDYEGVSVEGAREALARVGIIAADNAKAVVEQLAQAWEDSSLFASKENLALIDQAAVQENLDLQDKIKQGRRNILEFFSDTVDDALKPYILGDDVEVTQGADGGFVVTPKPRVDLSGIGYAGAAAGGIAGIDPTAIQAQLSTLAVPPITVSAISVDPVALEGLWDGLKPPAITITEISVGQGVGANFATALGAELNAPAHSEAYKSHGETIAASVEQGFIDHERSGMTQDFVSDLAGQWAGQVEGLRSHGDTIAAIVESGFTGRERTDMAQDFVSDLAGQWANKVTDFESHGGTIAAAVETGFITHAHGDMALAFYNTLAGQFGGAGAHGEATNLDKFSSLGMTLASIVEHGFTDPERERGDLASGTITAIFTQFNQQEHIDSLKTTGETAGYWLESGLINYPWSSVAGGIINEIQTGLSSEENIELLVAAGKNNLGGPLVTGVIQAFQDANWAELTDAVVTGVLESLADTEA